MKDFLKGIGAGALLGGLVLLAGCASDSHAGGPYYNYDYYPDYDVYYYPQAGLYYWQENGDWQSGGDLPPRINLHEHQHEQLHVRTRTPWLERHHAAPGPRHED